MIDMAFVHIRGARENNLKNIALDVPKHKITVFTGVSGSGKSSLVFDTIAAESQRQLNETFTAFADVLMYTLRGKTISDVLEMTLKDALEFFAEKKIKPIVQAMFAVRLSYLALGQPLST